jgi:hypothetical protein
MYYFERHKCGRAKGCNGQMKVDATDNNSTDVRVELQFDRIKVGAGIFLAILIKIYLSFCTKRAKLIAVCVSVGYGTARETVLRRI